MTPDEFQDEVIDRLARIETKQDTTNGRVTRLEGDVMTLQLDTAERRGTSRAITAGAGILGATVGGVMQYLFHH